MQRGDWSEISKLCGIPFSGYYDADDGSLPGGMQEGDRFYFHYCLAHARMIDPIVHYMQLPIDEREAMNMMKYKRFLLTMREFKNDTGMLDFSDMLEHTLKHGPATEVKVAIVDEAQDLSKIQWQFVETLFSEVDELYIAGDDDQAIYRWSGADLDTFLNLQGERKVLERSWRLPRQIWSYSNQFTSRISNRYEKKWRSDDRDGVVKFLEDPKYAPVSEGGEWLILVRNIYQMKGIEELCVNGGIPYTAKGRDAVKEPHMRAIKHWEGLRKGMTIGKGDAQNLYNHMRGTVDVKRGHKDFEGTHAEEFTMNSLQEHHGLLVNPDHNWWDALSRIPIDVRGYYRRIRRRGEQIVGKPRVNISTIHGVKGGEADNVLLLNSMAYRTRKDYDRNPDDEHRVFYVGATRAKKNLYLVRTKDRNIYPFPRSI